jgi:hypothetical protein
LYTVYIYIYIKLNKFFKREWGGGVCPLKQIGQLSGFTICFEKWAGMWELAVRYKVPVLLKPKNAIVRAA